MRQILIILIIFFIGCTTNPPKWYNKIYTDNKYYIYATGSGKTKEEAINSALANASAKIAIVVKSMYKSLKYQYSDNTTSTYSNTSILDIQTSTNPITFTNYKILKLEKKDKYYVLLKIDRYKNAKYMCQSLSIPSLNLDTLNLFLHYKDIINLINKKIDKVKNINAIYPLCKGKLKTLISLKQKVISNYNKLSYQINSNNNLIKNIITSIISIKKSSKGKIKIFVKTKINHKNINIYKITSIKIFLIIKTDNGSKNYYLTCASSSIQDYNTAFELAINKCKKKLKNIFNN